MDLELQRVLTHHCPQYDKRFQKTFSVLLFDSHYYLDPDYLASMSQKLTLHNPIAYISGGNFHPVPG